jgi:hypothetical protein
LKTCSKITGIAIILISLLFSILHFSSCNIKPEAEPLPLSVKSTLNLLQEKPQFVMYLNFNNMRRTEFWKKNVSDSMMNAEKTFGSLLNTFKIATGASVSDGIDELYYSNSWFGENAIIVKGIFDKNKLNSYLTTDSLFSITKYKNGFNIYIKNDNGLYFYFRDDFTICASNYLKQIDIMMETKDTSVTGLLLNEKVFETINNVIYKEDIWMVSTEKVFIKGIFQNFMETTTDRNFPDNDSLNNQENGSINDSSLSKDKITIENLYRKFSSVSFSANMDKELKLLIQGECINEESSKYLRSVINGLLTVAKLSSTGKQKDPTARLLNKVKLERYDNSVYVEMNIDETILKDLKKTNLLSEPE